MLDNALAGRRFDPGVLKNAIDWVSRPYGDKAMPRITCPGN
jgi:NAD(P)H-dependent FMN reductase